MAATVEERVVRLVAPVMGADECEAAVIALRAMLQRGELEDRSAHLVRDAVEAMKTAPAFRRPGENGVGPSVRGSATSRAAALRNYPRSGSQRLDVLHRVAREGARGATRDQLAEWLGRSPQSVGPRVKELVDGGWLESKVDDAGGVIERLTRTGSAAVVLVLSQRARVEMRRRGARIT